MNLIASANTQKLSVFFMMIFYIGLGIGCSYKPTYPISGLQLQAYPSVIAATKAAADQYNPISIETDREFMGAILERDGHYFYTVAVGSVGAGNIAVKLPSSHYGNVVALWHTHGKAAKVHQYFSGIDTALANKIRLPFYLADHTGQLKVFTPDSEIINPFLAKRLGLSGRKGLAEGELVLQQNNEIVTVKVGLNESKNKLDN